MAPIKFEEHIKEKLDQREIAPSDASWNSIAERLATEEKPKRGGYFWYGIAASFVGLLLISVLYFNKNEQQDPKATEMVNTPASEKEVKEESFSKKEIPVFIEEQEEAVAHTEKKSTISVPEAAVHKMKESDIQIANRNVEKSGTDVEVIVANEMVEKDDMKALTEAAIYAKIEEVIAQVDQKSGTTEEMTDVEVDSLLRKAQRELLTNKLFRTDNTVDAKALLAEAEGELDRSLRDQLFDALKTGYLKVRTAVADRNN